MAIRKTPRSARRARSDERHDEQIRDERSEQMHSGRNEQNRGSGRSRAKRGRDELIRDQRSGPEQLSERDRTTLVRVLGMLGSSNDHEALAAARIAETVRARLGLTWDDLIVAAAVKEQRKAA
jgi:hypothetical protein